jgi:hypothetical protein
MVISTIILANGAEFPTIAVDSNTRRYQGADRDMWEIKIPIDAATLDELRASFVAENLSEIILTETTTYEPETNEDGEVVTREPTVDRFYHYNYSIVKELGVRESQGMYFVELAQKTNLEITQEEQTEQITLLQDCILELSAK